MVPLATSWQIRLRCALLLLGLGAAQATLPAATIFGVIGDYGSDARGPSSAALELSVANLVKSWSPDFIVTTGDNNYNSGLASTIDQNVGKYYQEFIGNYTGAYGPGAALNRFFPSLGNHDWDDTAPRAADGTPSGYGDYFTLPGSLGAGYSTTGTSATERYYDVRAGDIHLFLYDADPREPDGRGLGSTQANWLQTQLAASDAAWKFVAMHHPPFSSGQHGNETDVQLPFQEWGADAVFAGHDHNLERIMLNEFPYLISGAGGRTSRPMADIISGSRFSNDIDNGALRVTVDGDQATFEFFSVSGGGTLLDRLVIDKSLPPPMTLTFEQNVAGYNGTVDTFLQQASPSADNSIAGQLNVDNDDPSTSGNDVQGLLRFEQLFGSAADQIPLDAEIVSATLELDVTNPGDNIRLHRMLVDWQDTDTWSSLSGGVSADGSEALSAWEATGAIGTGTMLIDVTASLRAWQLDPASNHGWALLPTGADGVDFFSAEGLTPPRLVVQFNLAVIPEPSTLVLLALGSVCMRWLGRRRASR